MKPKLGKLFICSLLIFTIISFNFPFTVLAVGSQVLKDSDRFIWIGKRHTSFSEEELQYIAQNYSFVVFEKMHAGRRMELQHQDARRLKELKPNIKVLVYFSMSYRFIVENDRYGGEEFDSHEEWYLHDKDNQKILHKHWRSGEVVGYWVDLSVPSYRQWVRRTVKQWINEGGYDGVAFDSARKLAGSYWEILGPNWQEKINDWNKGVDYLFQGVRADLGEDKLIIFNGIHRQGVHLEPGRNESILYSSSISGSLYEFFCYRGYNAKQFRTKADALEDVEFIYDSAKNHNKTILAKVLYGTDFEPTEQEVTQYSRYCFGLFLLSHVPGYTKFKFGPSYSITQQDKTELYQNALEINLPLGNPQGKYYQSGSFYQRNFANGLAVVNLENTPQTWTAPEKLELWNEGKYQRTLKKGDSLTLKVHDAAFLLKPNVVPSPSPTPTSIPGDLDGDGDVDIDDWEIMKTDFGKTGNAGWIPADIIKNGKVDIFDYNVLVGNFDQ